MRIQYLFPVFFVFWLAVFWIAFHSPIVIHPAPWGYNEWQAFSAGSLFGSLVLTWIFYMVGIGKKF